MKGLYILSMFESLHVLCSQLLERDGSQGLIQAFFQKKLIRIEFYILQMWCVEADIELDNK